MKLRLLMTFATACWLGGALCGCHGVDARQSRGKCSAIIDPDALPAGWRMLSASEMPPIDKTPWWTSNPQLLEGDAVQAIEFGGRPAGASKVWAAIYAKGYHRVVAFCLIYPTAQAAIAECRTLATARAIDGCLGTLKVDAKAIVIVSTSSPSDCPDWELFVKHFETVATRVPPSSGQRCPVNIVRDNG